MPVRFMEKWMNSNNCPEVTNKTFAAQICQSYTFDGKRKFHTGWSPQKGIGAQ